MGIFNRLLKAAIREIVDLQEKKQPQSDVAKQTEEAFGK